DDVVLSLHQDGCHQLRLRIDLVAEVLQLVFDMSASRMDYDVEVLQELDAFLDRVRSFDCRSDQGIPVATQVRDGLRVRRVRNDRILSSRARIVLIEAVEELRSVIDLHTNTIAL